MYGLTMIMMRPPKSNHLPINIRRDMSLPRSSSLRLAVYDSGPHVDQSLSVPNSSSEPLAVITLLSSLSIKMFSLCLFKCL